MRTFTFAFLVTASGAAANIIHVPADYPLIQAAINAGLYCDEVAVAPGTYDEVPAVNPEDAWSRYAAFKVTTTDGGIRQLKIALDVLHYYHSHQAGTVSELELQTFAGNSARAFDLGRNRQVEGAVDSELARLIKTYDEVKLTIPGMEVALGPTRQRLAVESNLQDEKDVMNLEHMAQDVSHAIYRLSQNDPAAANVLDGLLSQTKNNKSLVRPGTREMKSLDDIAKADPKLAELLRNEGLDEAIHNLAEGQQLIAHKFSAQLDQIVAEMEADNKAIAERARSEAFDQARWDGYRSSISLLSLAASALGNEQLAKGISRYGSGAISIASQMNRFKSLTDAGANPFTLSMGGVSVANAIVNTFMSMNGPSDTEVILQALREMEGRLNEKLLTISNQILQFEQNTQAYFLVIDSRLSHLLRLTAEGLSDIFSKQQFQQTKITDVVNRLAALQALTLSTKQEVIKQSQAQLDHLLDETEAKAFKRPIRRREVTKEQRDNITDDYMPNFYVHAVKTSTKTPFADTAGLAEDDYANSEKLYQALAITGPNETLDLLYRIRAGHYQEFETELSQFSIPNMGLWKRAASDMIKLVLSHRFLLDEADADQLEAVIASGKRIQSALRNLTVGTGPEDAPEKEKIGQFFTNILEDYNRAVTELELALAQSGRSYSRQVASLPVEVPLFEKEIFRAKASQLLPSLAQFQIPDGQVPRCDGGGGPMAIFSDRRGSFLQAVALLQTLRLGDISVCYRIEEGEKTTEAQDSPVTRHQDKPYFAALDKYWTEFIKEHNGPPGNLSVILADVVADWNWRREYTKTKFRIVYNYKIRIPELNIDLPIRRVSGSVQEYTDSGHWTTTRVPRKGMPDWANPSFEALNAKNIPLPEEDKKPDTLKEKAFAAPSFDSYVLDHRTESHVDKDEMIADEKALNDFLENKLTQMRDRYKTWIVENPDDLVEASHRVDALKSIFESAVALGFSNSVQNIDAFRSMIRGNNRLLSSAQIIEKAFSSVSLEHVQKCSVDKIEHAQQIIQLAIQSPEFVGEDSPEVRAILNELDNIVHPMSE